MDVDGGIVLLNRAGTTSSSIDDCLKILGKPLDDFRMARSDIGGFSDVSIEIVEFDLGSFTSRIIERVLVAKDDFPRALQKAELTMSGLNHYLVTRGSAGASDQRVQKTQAIFRYMVGQLLAQDFGDGGKGVI